MKQTILAINPGSTSTKIALFEGSELKYEKSLSHSSEDLAKFETISSQFEFRKNTIKENLLENGIELCDIDIVIGRGGLTYPIESGTYEVNDAMKRDLHNPPLGQHACNLGGLIADDLAREIRESSGKVVGAYIADPVVVDEMQDVARVSGHPKFKRISIFHALNQKAIARLYAKDMGVNYEDINVIVAHLGGGVSVGAHRRGRVVDVNNALDGDGPMSPERSGTIPSGQLMRMCFSGEYTKEEVSKMIKGAGGFVAHVGTNDARRVRAARDSGDTHAELILDAFTYQVSKAIGEMAVVLKGEVDAILITGGIAHGECTVEQITSQVSWIAPVKVYAGEDEMGALAQNALGVLTGEIEPRVYLGV
ncbi:MAG: butyrate kinase [Rikenellaceae bacterium]